MQAIYVSVGSNIDRDKNIAAGVRALREAFGQLLVSPVYQTPAVGFVGQDFFNLAVAFHSDIPLPQLQDALAQIETRQGRDRRAGRFAARTLDIDLLLYADHMIDQPGLRLPRREITEYAFVLAPLADIAGDMLHPELGLRIGHLWQIMQREKPQEAGVIRQIHTGLSQDDDRFFAVSDSA